MSDKFKSSNREKSNIAIAILEKLMLDGNIIISYFGGSNNIFANCMYSNIKTLRNVDNKESKVALKHLSYS